MPPPRTTEPFTSSAPCRRQISAGTTKRSPSASTGAAPLKASIRRLSSACSRTPSVAPAGQSMVRGCASEIAKMARGQSPFGSTCLTGASRAWQITALSSSQLFVSPCNTSVAPKERASTRNVLVQDPRISRTQKATNVPIVKMKSTISSLLRSLSAGASFSCTLPLTGPTLWAYGEISRPTQCCHCPGHGIR